MEKEQMTAGTLELTLLTPREEQKEDEKMILALNSWTWGRVRGIVDESNPPTRHDPDWSPEVVWKMETLLSEETVCPCYQTGGSDAKNS